MTTPPKYSRMEIERRWLVDLSRIDIETAFFGEIEDLYVAGTCLRLRKVVEGNERTFKHAKKYGKLTPLSEPITNLYLTEQEYRCLAVLPGARSRKRRYPLALGSLDVYVEPNEGLAILEAEFASERSAKEFVPPPFAIREVTNDPEFSGAALARDGRG